MRIRYVPLEFVSVEGYLTVRAEVLKRCLPMSFPAWPGSLPGPFPAASGTAVTANRENDALIAGNRSQ